jgi:hypothetical protein
MTNQTQTRPELPAQPQIVRDWIRSSRTAERSATNALFGISSVDAVNDAVTAVIGALEAAFTIPADVRLAYEKWADEYNAIVERHNAEVQARRNAREVAKIRAAACPSCFATHAGDC